MGWRDNLADWIRGYDAPVSTGLASGGTVIDEAKAAKEYALGQAMIGYNNGMSQWWEEHRLQKDATVASIGEYSKHSVAVYACVRVRASRLSTVPLRLYRLGDDGIKTEVTSGNLYSLLKRVNPYWTRQRLLDGTEQALCYYGEAFWVLNKTRKGPPSEIWWAHPESMTVNPSKTRYIDGYTFTHNGIRIDFDPDEVIWIPYFNPVNEFKGLSPIRAAQLAIDTSIDAMTANRKFFRNGMHIGGIISPKEGQMPFGKDQAKLLEEDLARRLGGVDKAHRFMILSNAADVKPFGISQRDAEFLDLMKWTLNDICRIYQIPPPIVQDFERSTYNNVEAALKSFWTLCLIPEGMFLAAEITEKLLPRFPGEADICEFDFSGIYELQEDQSEIVDQMAKLQLMGVPLNPLLRLYKRDLIPEGTDGYSWGDRPLLMPGQPMPDEARTILLTPIKPKPDAQQEIKTPSQAFERLDSLLKAAINHKAVPEYGSDEHKALMKAHDERLAPWEQRFKDLSIRLFKNQEIEILARLVGLRSAGNKSIDADNPFDRRDAEEAFEEAAEPLFREIVFALGAMSLATLRLEIAFDVVNPYVEQSIRDMAQNFARKVNDTTWASLKESLVEGQTNGEDMQALTARVQSVMGDRIRSSAETIARTESVRAAATADIAAWTQSGVVAGKTWLTTLDGRERDTHNAAHGQTVPINANFKVGKGEGPGPGLINAVEEIVNCRCNMTAFIGELPKSARQNGRAAVALNGGH